MSTILDTIRCEEIIADCVKNSARELDLSYLQPDSLPESLKKAKQLVKLSLNECVLDIPDWISELASLEHLDLRENRSVTALLPHIHKLKNLKWLSLAYADVNDLPDSFAELSNLEELNLDGADFTEFPQVIGKLRNLKSISLEYCYCKQEDIFAVLSKLPCLTKLRISFTRDYDIEDYDNPPLTAISKEIASLRNLEELDLSMDPDIGSLPDNIDELKHLKSISLEQDIDDKCAIKKLPDSIVNIETLESIDISDCDKITQFPEGIHKLHNLKKLHIAGSGIRDISCLSQRQLENIEDLHIQGKMPDFRYCKKLRSLNIFNNNSSVYFNGYVSGVGKEFDYGIPPLPNLDFFMVYGGKLASTDFLLQFPSLRELRLVCDMDSLPDAIGNLNRLESIDIFGGIHLKRLPESIIGISSLRELELTGCGVENVIVPNGITSLRLERLNSLHRLDAAIYDCVNLQGLRIERCQNFALLEDGISRLSNLSNLTIRDCYFMKSLPADMGRLNALENMTMIHTGIHDADRFVELPSLRFFDTDIEELSESFFKNTKALGLRLWHQNGADVLNKISANSSVKSLELIGNTDKVAIPKDILNNKTLEFLSISNCLPQGLENLRNIKRVCLTDIPKERTNEVQSYIEEHGLNNITVG